MRKVIFLKIDAQLSFWAICLHFDLSIYLRTCVVCARSKGFGETLWIRRFILAYAVRIADKLTGSREFFLYLSLLSNYIHVSKTWLCGGNRVRTHDPIIAVILVLFATNCAVRTQVHILKALSSRNKANMQSLKMHHFERQISLKCIKSTLTCNSLCAAGTTGMRLALANCLITLMYSSTIQGKPSQCHLMLTPSKCAQYGCQMSVRLLSFLGHPMTNRTKHTMKICAILQRIWWQLHNENSVLAVLNLCILMNSAFWFNTINLG